MNAQFEEFIHKFRDAVEQTKGPQRWVASSSVSGNTIYSFSRTFGTWVEFGQEAADPLTKAYGEQETGRLLGLLAASAANMTTTIFTARPDLSRPRPPAAQGAPAAPGPVAVLFLDLTVKLGKEQQFEDYVKKLIDATNKTAPEDYWTMRQRTFGPGNNPLYRVVVVFQSWADLDKPDKPLAQRMTERFGAAEGERLQALSTDALQGVNERMNRVRADLARPPAN